MTASTVFIRHLLAHLTFSNTAHCQADHSQASCSDAFCIRIQKLYKDSSGIVSLQGSPLTLLVLSLLPSKTQSENSSTHWIFVYNLGGWGGCGGWGRGCVWEREKIFLSWNDLSFSMISCSFWMCIDYLRTSFCLNIMIMCCSWARMLIFVGELGERNFLRNGYLFKNSHDWFCWTGVLIKLGCWFCLGCIISTNIQ